ncbi:MULTISPECIES: gas vesicle protein [unclassified Anabaena]|uniref:gas vesicle protein n=1 Tax=unclassified Anabaena TaxID=2619674 RepID=UPI001F54B1D6|nr:gas vesicle protein [Anabaena sp. UHCC 0399]MEA5567676.1 gas vesicle protein [Anabaena sp. UHCC 0399]
MKKIRNRGAIRPKITTMPRSKSESSHQLELYKLVTEQQRIKQELEFIEQRTVLLKQRLITLKIQIEDTEKSIHHLRSPESHVPIIIARTKIVFEPNTYQAFDIEY